MGWNKFDLCFQKWWKSILRGEGGQFDTVLDIDSIMVQNTLIGLLWQ